MQLMYGYIGPFNSTPQAVFDLARFRAFAGAVAHDALKPRDFLLDAAGRSSDKSYCRAIFLQILAARCPKLATAAKRCSGFTPPMLRSADRAVTEIVTLKALKCSETDKDEYAQLHEAHRKLMGQTREEMLKWLEVQIGDQLTVKVAGDQEVHQAAVCKYEKRALIHFVCQFDVKGDDNAFLTAQSRSAKLSGGLHLHFKLCRAILKNHYFTNHAHAVGSLARHAFLMKRKSISIDGTDTNVMFRFLQDTHTAWVVVLWQYIHS